MANDCDEDGDDRLYRVVVNDEEYYSIWPADRGAAPLGWRFVTEARSKQACREYIEEIWRNSRPVSIRIRREEEERARREAEGER